MKISERKGDFGKREKARELFVKLIYGIRGIKFPTNNDGMYDISNG